MTKNGLKKNAKHFSGKIYLMPGMGAKPEIFSRLRFPSGWQVIPVEWLLPARNESLAVYAARLIEHYRIVPDSVLLGMSFGGILIREIAEQIPVSGLVYISTVKSREELPPVYTIGRKLQVWHYLPYGLITRPERMKEFVPLKSLRKRIQLYEHYMGIKNPAYFKWAVKQLLTWKRSLPVMPYIHIHGTGDLIFPFKHLRAGRIPVQGAGHLAVMTHPFQINKILKKRLAPEGFSFGKLEHQNRIDD